ncbi:MAG: hypothetical protein AAF587_18940 [Bacteroidota bacterium]
MRISSRQTLSLKVALGRIVLLLMLGVGLMQIIDIYLPNATSEHTAEVDTLALPISENIIITP